MTGTVGGAAPWGRTPDGARSRRLWALVPPAVFLLFTIVLRAPVTAVPPLLGRMGEDLALSDVGRGLLTSVPVLCFGLLTPAASWWVRRVGVNSAGLWCLAMVLVGALVRSEGARWTAFAGTALVGAGITVGNLVAPMVIGREFRRRAALMTGLYTATVNVVVTASTALAVPLALAVGWQGSAAAWGVVPALLAASAWLWVFPPGSGTTRTSVRRRAGAGAGDGPEARASGVGTHAAGAPVLRSPLAWVAAAAFAGHTFSYYALTAWLPTALREMTGSSESAAGVTASVFQLTGIVGPMLVPLMFGALRWSTPRVMGVVCVCWFVLPVGLVAEPSWWLPWSIVGGVAQGAFFTALFTIVIRRSADVDENRRVSALVQTVGYCVAAAGPVVVGLLHQSVGGWVWPFCVVAVALAGMTACSQVVARARGGFLARPGEPAGAGEGTVR